jgi:phosphoribosylglycinamide formyltransferase-1
MERGEIPAEIRLVVSNNPQAVGIKRAKELGVATSIIPHRGLRRRNHEEKVLAALQEAEVDWVCLAGYMRLLSPNFVSVFPRRVLNIHPSLLPAFPGLDAQRQALEHGVKITGCTVHLVDEGLDSGPIIVQRSVDVAQEETEDLLAARILLEEHRAYPEALRRLLTEKWSIVGRRAVFRG